MKLMWILISRLLVASNEEPQNGHMLVERKHVHIYWAAGQKAATLSWALLLQTVPSWPAARLRADYRHRAGLYCLQPDLSYTHCPIQTHSALCLLRA